MKKFLESRLLRLIVLIIGTFAMQGLSLAQTQYVLTNDDLAFPFLTGVSFFTIGANGLPVFQQQVQTGTFGIGGGYFGMNRLAVLDSKAQKCVYASEALNAFIVGVAIDTLTVGGITSGSSTDAGTTNGIGMVMNGRYLYASFSDSNTIGTFAVQSGCSLTFIGDTSVSGVHGGVINGMAIHGAMLITSYTDGSIESFDYLRRRRQFRTATSRFRRRRPLRKYATYANAIDITKDGHYAIFGDTSTALSVEVSDISSGKLTKTTVYKSKASISSSNTMLSPDETILYVVNTQGATVSALFFDKNTGSFPPAAFRAADPRLSQNWSYLASAALINQTGNGGGVYVAEFGTSSGIATVTLSCLGQKCSLQEASGSPASDPNTVPDCSRSAISRQIFLGMLDDTSAETEKRVCRSALSLQNEGAGYALVVEVVAGGRGVRIFFSEACRSARLSRSPGNSGTVVADPYNIVSQNGALNAKFDLEHSVDFAGYTHYCYNYQTPGGVVEAPTLRVNPGRRH